MARSKLLYYLINGCFNLKLSRFYWALFLVVHDYSVFFQTASPGLVGTIQNDLFEISRRAAQPFLLCQQGIRSFLENFPRTPWQRWKLSCSALLWSGTTCTPMTTTPDVSSWGRSRTESRGSGAAWEDCYWTLTASSKPTTSLCIHLAAGTEQGRKRAKVRRSQWKNVIPVARQGVTLTHYKHRQLIMGFFSRGIYFLALLDS